MMKYKILSLLISLTLLGCGNKPDNVEKVASMPPIFPDYVGVTIPVEIAPLNFAVVPANGEADRVDVTVKGAGRQ